MDPKPNLSPGSEIFLTLSRIEPLVEGQSAELKMM
jgi:hypothetical protein